MIGTAPPARLAAPLTPAARDRLQASLTDLTEALDGRVLWNISSTAAGGGVAEMLRSMLPYLRGAGLDVRWTVITGDAEFFRLTKRLHNLLHGFPGDGGPLGRRERSRYEATLQANALGLAEAIRPGDVVLLQDPQTAGLVPSLQRAGAIVVWRSHVGTDHFDERVRAAWRFLARYVQDADALVFSRPVFVPPELRSERVFIIPPSIDPAGTKNQDVDAATATAILAQVGLAQFDPADGAAATFVRQDGSPGRVEHGAEVLRIGPPPRLGDEPLVVQVSRWDDLKDPEGVLRGFVEHVLPRTRAQLTLAGPTVHSVADDPEAATCFDRVVDVWRTLPRAARRHVQLACLPMRDLDENAAIVNALQRSASVVVQKSLQEGFGLTVTEAMWKAKPVVASGVGGLNDQIETGRSGILLPDPRDLAAFGTAVAGLVDDPARATEMGRAAHEVVRDRFLHDRQIAEYAALVTWLLAAAG
jgi:trehalose synthase